MSEAAVTVRVRKFMRNPLLKRRQMVCYDYCELELDDRSDSSQACFCLKGRAQGDSGQEVQRTGR